MGGSRVREKLSYVPTYPETGAPEIDLGMFMRKGVGM
jgi:hypothetical protein